MIAPPKTPKRAKKGARYTRLNPLCLVDVRLRLVLIDDWLLRGGSAVIRVMEREDVPEDDTEVESAVVEGAIDMDTPVDGTVGTASNVGVLTSKVEAIPVGMPTGVPTARVACVAAGVVAVLPQSVYAGYGHQSTDEVGEGS